jgi:GT2 family glycosyltransferase
VPPDVGVVVLTLGDRPAALERAVNSALAQHDVAVQVIVVANGAPAPPGLSPDARVSVFELDHNAGIPGGRNEGARRCPAELVAFLDDDARFVDESVLSRAAAAFQHRPALGALALRIVDDEGRTARRHVPRIGARHPDRAGAVTAFLGGAVVMRRAAFDGVGGFPSEFVYAMEETDLSFRLIDAGWEIHYDGTPAVYHPRTEPARHPGAAERTMRNRVWLANRSLPAPIAVLYVANWLLITTIRRPRQFPALVRAVRGGWRTRPGPRAPIRWRTVARLTRLGRPPVL